MGDDEETLCTACGRQKQQHALIIRDDGVVIAGSIRDPYSDWEICADIAQPRDTLVDDGIVPPSFRWPSGTDEAAATQPLNRGGESEA